MGFVLIFFALAAYRNVFDVSDRFDNAGETQATYKDYVLPSELFYTNDIALPSELHRCPQDCRRGVSLAYYPCRVCELRGRSSSEN